MTAELVAASNFSFLRGASHPADMLARALALGHAGLGLADRNSVAGTPRAHLALRDAVEAAREQGLAPPAFKLAVGARLVFADGTPDIVAYPATRHGWGRLCRLLTRGNLRCEKGGCLLALDDLLRFHEELLLIILPDSSFAPEESRPIAESRRPKDWDDAVWAPDAGAGEIDWARGERLKRGEEPLGAACALQALVEPQAPFGANGSHVNGTEIKAMAGATVHYLPGAAAAPDAPAFTVPDEATRRRHARAPDRLRWLIRAAPGRVWLAARVAHQGRDRRRLAARAALAERLGVPLLATCDALYADPEARPLHDVMTAIRLGMPVAEAGRRLHANAERHLKSPAEMARLFADYPDAVAETDRLLARIDFSLDQLGYEYPHEPIPPGWTPMGWLRHLVLEAAHARHGAALPQRLTASLDEEFALIEKCGYAPYFLTVHDIVRFAREQTPPILCQGRGSAANSAVCFLLGITSVDPMQHDLLFSRFVSEERREPPDIDVDFEHERREEVMQYIFRRYGRHRAGIAATVIHYRPRSAVREVGKALGFTEDVTARISSTVWGSFASAMEEKRFAETGFSLDNPAIARLKWLVDQLLHTPRHLSQHVGGFVLARGRLDEMVPIHNGAMAGRSFIEWDKDDIDGLKLMKVDVLALGMLTCIRKSFELMRAHGLGDHRLDDVPAEDAATYDMLCKGDSIGVFQVESRAQINMLPRLKPRCLYDLTVQVAIVRPGPIQGDMVHPYLRRRAGIEPVEFPSPAPPHDPDELRRLLGQTFGVPLFQEQAMKLAIVAAGFTPSEANQLRRSMATFRRVGGMDKFHEKLVGGMVARGYAPDFAERCYKQIEGFGSYGFPESHALSFARLVYVSSWIKCHQPAAFACALLNSQPMGFYAPAQIVRDAREHGVAVQPIDVNASDWDNGLEMAAGAPPALRLGFRQIDGFRADWAARIVAARQAGRFDAVEALARRADLPRRALRLLADADAFGSLGLDRRAGLWEARRTPPGELPLFAAARARELAPEPDMALPAMTLAEQVVADYQLTRLSLKAHPMAFLRAELRGEGVASAAEIVAMRGGARAKAAGVVLVRQRPGNGNAIFITLEDETGVVNIVLWASRFERYRRAVMAARLMEVQGEVQRSPEGVIHLMAARVIDRTALLDTLGERGETPIERSRADEFDHPQNPRGADKTRHPRDVRILPKSRDFH